MVRSMRDLALSTGPPHPNPLPRGEGTGAHGRFATSRRNSWRAAPMIRDVTPVARLDWDSPGKRLYHVPFTLDGTWGRTRMPLGIVRGPRPGPTIVAIGGTHGDEYEGPVGLKNLLDELPADEVIAGR